MPSVFPFMRAGREITIEADPNRNDIENMVDQIVGGPGAARHADLIATGKLKEPFTGRPGGI